MSKQHSKLYKIFHPEKKERFIMVLWAILVILAVGSLFSINVLHNAQVKERNASTKLSKFIEISYELQLARDYLTSQARTFAVVVQPKHLIDYWREVDITQTREKAIKRLKTLGAKENEIALLVQSKRNSDALVQTEIRAMKLVMVAFDVPDLVMNEQIARYELPASDLKLDFNSQLSLAQEIMFNKDYFNAMARATAPILAFQNKVKTRLQAEIYRTRTITNSFYLLLVILLSLITTLIVVIIWLRRT